MGTRKAAVTPAAAGADGTSKLLRQYGCGPAAFTGTDSALDERHLLFDNVIKLSDHFSPKEPGVFAPLRDTLLTHGDHYIHLADLGSYLEADRRLVELYADPDAWARKALLNVANSGTFSSDRTIAEYAADVWNADPCPVE
jgi:glucan phosphorylase